MKEITTEFNDVEFGLLFMTNFCNGDNKYKHNWDSIKRIVKEKNASIALVSIIKERVQLQKTSLNILRKRNDYYPWNIVKIDYWIHKENQAKEGNLWKK